MDAVIDFVTREKRGPEALNVPEHLGLPGATELAARLRDWWVMRGFPFADFRPVMLAERFEKIGAEHVVYRIAHNLINGYPPRCVQEWRLRKSMLS